MTAPGTTDLASYHGARAAAMREALQDAFMALQRIEATAGDLESEIREGRDRAHAKSLRLIGRVQEARRAVTDAIAADSAAGHERAERDPGSPFAEGNIGAARPVGLSEIAAMLGVRRDTVDQWRSRGILPEPTWPSVGGRPAWRESVIRQWARETGRLPR